jgi:pimeloyl-ACP methyl ester carboxylesterase
MTRALVIGLLAILIGWAFAGRAEAAQDWRSCLEGPGVRCTTIDVPLDRGGGVPGTVPLRVARLRRPRDARDDAPVMMYLSGGPGGAGISEMLGVIGDLPDLARRFVVVGFDQRGTGRSGLVRCPEMQRDRRVRSTAAAASCAARLGARRAFYTTPDSVEDMEAIRLALGVRRLTLFGISYGTQLALEYARAHPEAVQRLVLDSVVDPDDTDPFGLAGLRAMPRTLEALCPQNCRGISADPGRDLAALTAALRAEPLRGPVYDAAGRERMRTLTPTSIADLLYDADYAPQLRAAVPAAVRAALEHADPAPLLRLQELAAPLSEPEPASAFSAGRYSLVCEETPLPWDDGTPPAERAAVAEARAQALGEEAFAPFDAAVAFADEVELCLRWPAPFRPAPAPPGPYPDVPALLLQGEEDLRTPPSASAAVAARLPQAQRVVVPGVGHAVVAADLSGCGQRRLHDFLDGRSVAGRCPRVPTGVPPVEVPPVRFAAMRTRPGLPARAGRTIDAVRATLVDVAAAASLAVPGGGLRGGRYTVAGTRLVLVDVVVVPGVRVSGRIGFSGTADLRVTGGAAARGRLRLDERGRLTGRLSGRPIELRPRAARVRVARFGSGLWLGGPGLRSSPSRRLAS